MPSSVIRRAFGQQQQVSYPFPASYRPNEVIISASSYLADGNATYTIGGSMFATSSTYPAANRALGFMFCLGDYFLVRKVWWMNGTTATTNNADVGVYTEDGATLLVSGGGTLIATANVLQEVDVTDTLLQPGRYWCVYNQNGTTATPIASAATAPLARASGWAQFAGAVPLGSTFTPAAIAGAVLPVFGIASRTQVA